MKVWFNQSYSMRNFVRRFIMDRPEVALCISSVDPWAAVRDIAPVFWAEPESGSTDYTQWLLETALRHGIDALVPQRGKVDVVRARSLFADSGVRVHAAASAEILELLDDKAAFAASLAGSPYLCPTRQVTSAAGFEQAVTAVTKRGAVACVKPSRGVYGAGYWTLDADAPLTHIADPDGRRIAAETYAASLRQADERGDAYALVVMEHLPGLEASVDIVADQGRVMLAAVRTKLAPSRQRIETRHPLIAPATQLVRQHGLHGAVNVQYKQDREGAWRILEINARAAGGAPYCDEVGIPFCATWLDVVTGTAVPFEGEIDAEIVAVTRAERWPAM